MIRLAVAGGVLLLGSLFLAWSGLDLTPPPDTDNLAAPMLAAELGGGETSIASRVFDSIVIVLAVLAAAIVVLAVRGRAKATAVTAGAALLLAICRLVVPALDDIEPDQGAWLALAGSILALAASGLALRRAA